MDASWLAAEAKTLHETFHSLFFVMVSTLLVIGVVIEFFKLPLGGKPQFTQLVGRALIATLLLVAVPEIMNALASVTDSIVEQIGSLNQFKLVLSKLGERLHGLSWSWVSVKDLTLTVISFLTFFLLYITVYLADAFFLFSWMLLYIMSPVLTALFVLPATAGATKQLFSSMFQVCAWKIMWGVLAALLWSFALSDINNPDQGVSFLTAILLNLMLAFSLALTPKMTAAFLGGGIAQMADSFGNTLMSAAKLTPPGLIASAKRQALSGNSFTRRRIAKPIGWVGAKAARPIGRFAVQSAKASYRGIKSVATRPVTNKTTQKPPPPQSPKST